MNFYVFRVHSREGAALQDSVDPIQSIGRGQVDLPNRIVDQNRKLATDLSYHIHQKY